MSKLVFLKSKKLAEQQTINLYTLYCDTYGNIGETGNLMSKEAFNKKVNTESDMVILQITNNEENTNIENCFLVRRNEFGNKISYAFGDRMFAKKRAETLAYLIKTDFYTAANGAPAKVLLRDKDIKIVLEKDLKHYYGQLGSHGKKLIFGNFKGGVEVTPSARLFFFYLYEYSKLKFKQYINEEPLVALYNAVYEEAKMPKLYQLILLSKLARKLCSINPNHIDKLIEINANIIESIAKKDAREHFLVSAEALTLEEEAVVGEILSEKRASILGKGINLFSSITAKQSGASPCESVDSLNSDGMTTGDDELKL